jgi:hypothetical protein
VQIKKNGFRGQGDSRIEGRLEQNNLNITNV